MQSPNPQSENPQLDALVAEYLEAIERGHQLDRELFVQQHPDFAAELRVFFADLDRMQATKLQIAAEQDATVIPQHEPKPGTQIGGRYKLLENIGEGGMGSVWVAEQKEPVKRRVAIKLIKAGMDSKQVLARFEAERQALAVMDHPNIAKVFDGGMTENGRPFFVMEYVKGVPFTEYCDKARLSLKERLSLFIPVCQAVQHAHHKGIVHRDLKPSNILICLYDGKPVPKVIDFGLAKAMNQSLTEHSIFTGHGVMVGTPLYMSPEQAENNNLDVDTRTDIYSLGVVLYELLTGTTPLAREQLRTAAYQEILRLIKEVEPLRPSTRLSGSATLPSVAAQRNIDPRHLQRSLAGDLDWIVMKSLEKDRSRRYETATGLARDIERFLNEEAVEACPPSRIYRMKKLILKHRIPVAVGSAILAALVIAIVGATWGWYTAHNAEKTVQQSLSDVTKERNAKNDALDAKTAAFIAESDARAVVEDKLIEGILRSIGQGDQPAHFPFENVPDNNELRSLFEWSTMLDARLKRRVLESAFENPMYALGIARRSERSMQAYVGLSPTRRTEALRLFDAKQRDVQSDPRIRVAAAWLAIELGSADLPALPETLTYMYELGSDANATHETYREFFATVSRRFTTLRPEQIALCVDHLASILENPNAWPVRAFAADSVVLLAPFIQTSQIPRIVDVLIGVLENHNSSDIPPATKCMVLLVPKLNSLQITRCCDAIIDHLENSRDGYESEYLMTSLADLVPQLSEEMIKRSWNVLVVELRKPARFLWQRNFLAVLAPKLAPEDIAIGWDQMIDVISTSENEGALIAAGEVLVALVPKLTAEQLDDRSNDLIRVLEIETHYWAKDALCKAMVTLVPQVDPAQRMRIWDAMIAAQKGTADPDIPTIMRTGLGTLAGSLSSDQILHCGNQMIAMLRDAEDWRTSSAAANGLTALASRLSPDLNLSSGEALIKAMYTAKDWPTQQATANALEALAPKLSLEQTTRAADALLAVLEATEPGLAQQSAANTLAVMAAALDETQLKRATKGLICVLEKTEGHPGTAENGLVNLTKCLHSDQQILVCDAMVGLLERAEGSSWFFASENIVSLASNLTKEQSMHCADAVIRVLESTSNDEQFGAAARVIVTLAPQLTTEYQARIGDLLFKSLHSLNNSGATPELARLLTLLSRPNREKLHAVVVTTLLDYHATSSTFAYYRGRTRHSFELGFRDVIVAAPTAELMATELSHPGCVELPRDFLVKRFEEFVFHDGKHVFLRMSELDAASPIQTETELPPRRFHTIYDVAAWIQANWPDFDLEAPHPVTWRGKM